MQRGAPRKEVTIDGDPVADPDVASGAHTRPPGEAWLHARPPNYEEQSGRAIFRSPASIFVCTGCKGLKNRLVGGSEMQGTNAMAL